MFIRIWINLGAFALVPFLHQEDLPSYNIGTKEYHPEKKGQYHTVLSSREQQ